MDEKNSDDNQKDSYSQSKNDQAPTARNSEIGPSPDYPPSKKENPQGKSKQKITEAASPHWGLTWAQWLNLGFTGVIAAAAVLYTMSAFRQLDVLNRQSTAMEKTLKVTQQMADASKDGANAAKRAAGAAEKSAETARRSLEIAERAWVGLKSMRLVKELTPGEKMTIEIVVENTGRTPAKQIRVIRGIRPSNKRLTDKPHFRKSDRPGSIGTMLTSGILRGYISTNVLPAETIEKIKKGGILIYVYQAVTYFDVFDRPHETQIFGLFTPKKGNREMFEVCDHHNQMN